MIILEENFKWHFIFFTGSINLKTELTKLSSIGCLWAFGKSFNRDYSLKVHRAKSVQSGRNIH